MMRFPPEKIVCPACHLGHMHLRKVTYIRQFGETLISVPNTPAWECDVCHQREFDPESVQRIEVLVGQVGAPPNRHTATPEPVEAAQKPAMTAKEPKTQKPRAKAKP
jgi:YgiT-type zinc finger domain-containing protein